MAPATHLSGYLKKEGKKQSLLVRTHVAAVIGHFRPDGVASSHDTGTGG